MNKLKITVLLVALIMVFSGCSLVSVDEERVANQVVASVNGEEIYKYEIDSMAEYYAYYYYGLILNRKMKRYRSSTKSCLIRL